MIFKNTNKGATSRHFTSCTMALMPYEGRSKSYRPDLVLFRIKLKYYWLLIVARLRTRHAQYDFWAINILCILVVVGCLHTTRKKNRVTQCSEVTILTDSFIPLHALLFWLRNEVVDPCFILNNELYNKLLLDHVSIVREFSPETCAQFWC